MLNPDEVASYEEWKQRKIQGQLDLSVQAYNLEQESVALAWEDGWVARDTGKLFTDNQFRKPGMSGYRAHDPDPDPENMRDQVVNNHVIIQRSPFDPNNPPKPTNIMKKPGAK